MAEKQSDTTEQQKEEVDIDKDDNRLYEIMGLERDATPKQIVQNLPLLTPRKSNTECSP